MSMNNAAARADIEFFASKYGARHLGKSNAQFGNTFSAGDFHARLTEMGLNAELVEIDRHEWVVTW